MPAINIILADAQFLVRLGFRNLISQFDQFNLVGEAISEDHLLDLIEQKKPELIVLDYHQVGSFSINTISRVKNKYANLRIVIISSDNDKSRIDKALEYGVNGFLTKECAEDEIVGAINATAKGEKYFCNNVLNFLLEKSYSTDYDCSPTPLSERETEIVRLIAQGKIAKEIASELNLSTHTIYTHRKNIMKKLNFSSASELVLYAVDKGIVSTSEN